MSGKVCDVDVGFVSVFVVIVIVLFVVIRLFV